MLIHPNPDPADRRLSPSAGGTEPITVLVIEDDPSFACLLCDLLGTEEDLQVVGVVSTVAAGVSWARRLRPRAVLTDYHLGDGTGEQAATLIKQLSPSTPIIMMSSDVSGVARSAAERFGADAYLDKAESIGRLAELIRVVVTAEPAPTLSLRTLSVRQHV